MIHRESTLRRVLFVVLALHILRAIDCGMRCIAREYRRKAMLRRMEEICRAKGLFSKGASIVIACSGGPDSLALADLLRRMAGRWELRLCIAHFEHGIRGEASIADARFVEEQAKRWGIPFYMESADVPAYAKERQLSLETAARRLRHRFLSKTCDQLGFDWIALAHHADDQAETILMHLLRGSGLEGLTGIRAKNGRLIRPLLEFRKQELEDYCLDHMLEPRLDATNEVPEGTRNRIRLKLLPELRKEYNASVETSLLHLGRMAGEIHDFLQTELQRVWVEAVRWEGERPELSQEVFRQLHPTMQRVLLRAYLAALSDGSTRDMEFIHFEKVRELLTDGTTGGQCDLPHGLRIRLSYGWLHRVADSEQEYPLCEVKVPGWTELPAYGISLWTELLSDAPKETGALEYYCDYRKLRSRIFIRGRHEGDRISCSGGTKKLKELFIDTRLRQEQRDGYPLLVSGEQILWVPGIRRSNLFPVDEGTKEILYVRMGRKGDSRYDEG